MLGRKIYVGQVSEGPALVSAFFAAVAAGIYGTPLEASEQMGVKDFICYEPDEEHALLPGDSIAPNRYAAGSAGGTGIERQIKPACDHFFCCITGKRFQKHNFIAIHRAGDIREQNQILWQQL